MATTTAQTVITGAFRLLGIIAAEETPTSAQSSDGLRRLNMMIGQWSICPLTIPYVAREVFNLVANQASYTMGPGGNFDTTRPADLVGAGLILGNTSPSVELPRALITDDAYQAIQIKGLTNPLFTDVYYNPTYSGGLGTVTLWPVPDNADNQIVLYRLQQLPTFTTLTATYQIAEGTDEPMEYNLACRLAAPWGTVTPPEVQMIARASLRRMKYNNVKLTDLPQDLAFIKDQRYGYNIVTGTGGGGGS